MRTFLFVISIALIGACSKASREEPEKTAPSAPVTATRAPTAPTPAPEPAGPISMSEERFQKWMEYRRAYQEAIRKNMAELAQKPVVKDQQKSVTGTLGTVQAFGEAGQAIASEVDALQKKYGFTKAEDDRLWKAAGDIVSAKGSENPMLASTFEMMRNMAKQGGPAKEGAEKFLREQEEKEKKGLADARTKYGDEVVDVFSKHVKDLSQAMQEIVGAAFGKPRGAVGQPAR